MPTVTNLQVQKRNKQRVSVFLDGAFAFGLPRPVAEKLRIGQELDDAKLAEIHGEATIEAAKQSAMRFISYRPRSSAEIRRNLHKKEYEPAIIEQTVAWLEKVNMVDDSAFARYWVEQRETFKPRSHYALRQELQQKGVARELIDEVLSAVDEEASARRAAETRANRWQHLPEDQFRAKIGRFLQSRGFGYGIIRQVTDELWQQEIE